ncbi:MAG: ATP-binding protein [Planctomycetes bacterium]|nr:ATP-binding protein [Planctomycetota bacterium]
MGEVRVRELSKKVSTSLHQSEALSARVLESFVAAVKGALVSGHSVELPGFGLFLLNGGEGAPRPADAANGLCADLAARLSEPDARRAEEILASLVDTLRAELLAGRKVALDDIGTFEVRHQGPVVERQPLGCRLIQPARSQLLFLPAKPVLTPSGEARLSFVPSEDLQRSVERMIASTILFLCGEDDFFGRTLEYYFRNAGWEFEIVTGVPSALTRLETGRPCLAIVDGSLPDSQEFCRALKFGRQTTNAPLITLHPDAREWERPTQVMVLGNENLTQPFEFRELLEAADGEIRRAWAEEEVFVQQVAFRLPSSEAAVDQVVEQIQRLLEQSGMEDKRQVALVAALREAAVNAAQHGNRFDPRKAIDIQYLLDADKLTLNLTDQGDGFDHEAYVRRGRTHDAATAARERHAEGRLGGLGVMLMLRCCDDVKFNSKGNQVTLVKYLKSS